MAQILLGNARHQLDEKNRFRIPVKFRDALGKEPVIVPGKNGCAYVVGQDRFNSWFSSVSNENPYFSDTDELLSVLSNMGGDLKEDSQGRMTLEKKLKDFLDIDKELVFVGKINYLEVWPAEKWDARYGVLNPDKIDKMIQDLRKRGV